MVSHLGNIESPRQLNIRHPHPQLQLYKEMGELAESAVTGEILTGREEEKNKRKNNVL